MSPHNMDDKLYLGRVYAFLDQEEAEAISTGCAPEALAFCMAAEIRGFYVHDCLLTDEQGWLEFPIVDLWGDDGTYCSRMLRMFFVDNMVFVAKLKHGTACWSFNSGPVQPTAERRLGRPREWTDERIERVLLELVNAGNGAWPTVRTQRDAGYPGLLAAIARYGGATAWAARVGAIPPRRRRLRRRAG